MVTIFCCQETNSCFSWLEYASLDKQRSRRPEKIDIVFGSVEGARRRLEHTFLFHRFLTSQLTFSPAGGFYLRVVMIRATIAEPSVMPDTCEKILLIYSKSVKKKIAKFCFYRKCVNQRKCGRKERERE